ncbi:MAG: HAMP domain-containing histidine kinase [Deltaproteobacteria bacterium]|nr:HAMP domain-containing histidine kinase [Deltaproteobacteria bacterium]
MSLRLRLFLLFGALVVLLMGAQWLMIRSLSHDLSSEVRGMAASVGTAVISVIQEEDFVPLGGEVADGEEKRESLVNVRVLSAPSVEEATEMAIEMESTLGGEGTSGPPRITIDESSSDRRIVKIVHNSEEGAIPHQVEPELLAQVRKIAAHMEARTDDDALILRGPHLERRIPIPRDTFDDRVSHFSSRLLVGTSLLLGLGLVLAGALAHRVTQPLQQLSTAAKQVGEGALGVQVDASASGEVGATLTAFNTMSAHLERLEEDTRRLRAGQQLSELGEISRGIAHSLRNPLNALGLSVDSLEGSSLDSGRRAQLAAGARQQIRRMDRSLRSFLALASSGGAPEQVDVGAVLQDVVLEAIQNAVAGKEGDESSTKPHIEAHPQPDLEPLRAVAPELRAVLQALVVNAVEASPPGGRVSVGAESWEGDRIRITVEDEGPGLPKSVRDRLFTPHLTTKAQGSGMGLFLAHRIAANRYDGSLELEDMGGERGNTGKGQTPSGTRAVLILGPRRGAEDGGASND